MVGVDSGGIHSAKDKLIEAVGCGGATIDIGRSRVGAEATIELNGVDNAIQACACGGLIAVEIGEPISNITHFSVGIAVFILKPIVACDAKANVIDSIQNCVDEIQSKKLGVCSIVLNQVVTSFRAVFIIPMVGDEKVVAALIRSDPLVDPAHLIAAQSCGITICLSCGCEGIDAPENQVIQIVRRCCTAGNVYPADVVG